MADRLNATPPPAPDLARVTPATPADAELLTLAAEFAECDARMVALGAPDAPDGVWESAGRDVQTRWWQIVDRVIALPAHTRAGIAAKASLIPGVFRDLGDEDTADHKLGLSLVHDLTGQAAPGADADLLAACAAMDALSAEFAADPRDQEPGTPEDAAREANDARITQQQRAALARIDRAPPCTTIEGARTLARTLMREFPDILKDLDDGMINHGLQRALIVKLLAQHVRAPAAA